MEEPALEGYGGGFCAGVRVKPAKDCRDLMVYCFSKITSPPRGLDLRSTASRSHISVLAGPQLNESSTALPGGDKRAARASTASHTMTGARTCVVPANTSVTKNGFHQESRSHGTFSRDAPALRPPPLRVVAVEDV